MATSPSARAQRVDPPLRIRPDLDESHFAQHLVGAEIRSARVRPGRVATEPRLLASPSISASSSARRLGLGRDRFEDVHGTQASASCSRPTAYRRCSRSRPAPAPVSLRGMFRINPGRIKNIWRSSHRSRLVRSTRAQLREARNRCRRATGAGDPDASVAFMKTNFSASNAAPAPLAESTTIVSRCSARRFRESTNGTSGLNQATDGSPSATRCVRQLTVSRRPLASTQPRGPRSHRPRREGDDGRSRRSTWSLVASSHAVTRARRRAHYRRAWATALAGHHRDAGAPGRSTQERTRSLVTGWRRGCRGLADRPAIRESPACSSMSLVISASGGEPCWISGSQLLRAVSGLEQLTFTSRSSDGSGN